MDTSLLTGFLLAMLAIVNPLGKVPVWLGLSDEEGQPVRTRLATLLVLTGLAILLVMLVLGTQILDFFGVDLASFQVAGGVFLLLVGLSMLRGEITNVELSELDEDEDPMKRAKRRFRETIVPMCVPFLAGPGSITTVVVFGSRADGEGWTTIGAMAGVLVGVFALIWGTLLVAHRIQDVLGEAVLTVQTRLFGIFLAAIAAQMMLEGLAHTFPRWVDASSVLEDDVRETQEGILGEAGSVATGDEDAAPSPDAAGGS